MPQLYRESAIGRIGLEETSGALTRIMFPGEDTIHAERKNDMESSPLLEEAFGQLDAYFHGHLREFNLPLDPKGTPFMKSVWNELRKIPYGKTASYKDIAVALGKPGAMRAVGLANNRNPLPLVIPCHRVIGANGKLIGFGGGLSLKQWLLDLEHRHSS